MDFCTVLIIYLRHFHLLRLGGRSLPFIRLFIYGKFNDPSSDLALS